MKYCAGPQPHVFEGREIVQMPGNWHFDQVDGPPPAIFFGGGKFIADTAPVRRVIAAHQAALVFKAIFQKQRHRRRAVVPSRRAVADRPHAGNPVERLKAALQNVTLLFRRQHGWVLVDPAVVSDFVTGRTDHPCRLGKRYGGVARDEECTFDAEPVEKVQDAA